MERNADFWDRIGGEAARPFFTGRPPREKNGSRKKEEEKKEVRYMSHSIY
jgi:hypothetical protein